MLLVLFLEEFLARKRDSPSAMDTLEQVQLTGRVRTDAESLDALHWVIVRTLNRIRGALTTMVTIVRDNSLYLLAQNLRLKFLALVGANDYIQVVLNRWMILCRSITSDSTSPVRRSTLNE
jgi:hypothetical protein